MVRDNIRYIKEIKKCECGGKLQPMRTLFGNRWENMKKKFKKEFGKELKSPTGYRCPKCGACYDENFKRESYRLSVG